MNLKQKKELLNIFEKQKNTETNIGIVCSFLAIFFIGLLTLGLYTSTESLVLLGLPLSIFFSWMSLLYIVVVAEDRIKINNIKLSMRD